jgi:hypothetical protein
MRAVALLTNLVDDVQASLGRHKLEKIVNGSYAAHIALISRGLEARPDLELLSLHDDRVGCIEEPWGLTDLAQVSGAERIFDDNVDDLLLDIVVLVTEGVIQVDYTATGHIDRDCVLLALDLDFKNQVFFDLLQRVDALA